MKEHDEKDERFKNFSIEIDCEPGFPRPGHLFPAVLVDTGLKEEDFDNTARVFGNWIWVLKEGDPERDAKFTKAKPIFKERLTQMYDAGYVRYVSW